MNLLCALNLHHHTCTFVGNEDAPNAHVLTCRRCGQERNQ